MISTFSGSASRSFSWSSGEVDPAQHGTCENMWGVCKGVKVFNVGDEFLMHVFKALLDLHSTSDSISHENCYNWLRRTAEKLLTNTLMPKSSSDPSMHRSFLHIAFLYIDLRNAGPHNIIVRMWKLWLPRFIGTGRKNYATESVHLLANLCADFPKHISYYCNTQQNSEHKWENWPWKTHWPNGWTLQSVSPTVAKDYSLFPRILKEAMRAGGSNITPQHIEDLSLCGLFLMDVTKKVDDEYQVHHTPPQMPLRT